MTMTPKNIRKPGPDGPFENTLQHEKPQHVQKGASRQTSVLSLIPHYYSDFFADLVLVFRVIIR